MEITQQQRRDVLLSEVLQESDVSKSLFFFCHATNNDNKNIAREAYYEKVKSYDGCQIPNYKMYSFAPNLQILMKYILQEIRITRENKTVGTLNIKSSNIIYHDGKFSTPKFNQYLKSEATGENVIKDLINLLTEIIKSCGLDEEDDEVDDKKPPEVCSFYRALKDETREIYFREHHFSLWDEQKRKDFYMSFSGKIKIIDPKFKDYLVRNYNHAFLEYIPQNSIIYKIKNSTDKLLAASKFNNGVPYFTDFARILYAHYDEYNVLLRELDQEISQTFPFVLNFICNTLVQINAYRKF